ARGVVERVSRALDPGWALGEAERLAPALAGGGIPVVVACGAYAPLAWRWRSELAENTGIHALVEEYPEAGHNAVNAWVEPQPGRWVFIVIKASAGDEVCSAIEDWVEGEYSRRGEAYTLDLKRFAATHPLAALLEGAMVAGVASSLAAVRMGRDPAATPGIRRYREAVRAVEERLRRGGGV
ncbi:SIS domain-containing protein, partial [Stetteria hydrogenophila]